MTIPNKNQENADMSIHPQVTQSHPWLIMFNGWEKETQIFFSISKGRYYARNIPKMAHKWIFSKCLEWLVLVDYENEECSLLNLISMEKVELPKYEDIMKACYLTCPPEDPNCHVLFFDMDYNIYVCQLGDDKFIKRSIHFPEGDLGLTSVTYFDGYLYVLVYPSGSLIRANICDPKLEFQTVMNGESLQNELLDLTSHPYLTESCGELLIVTKFCLHEEAFVFHVFRADFSNSQWILLRSIGDRAIFMEPLSNLCISCSSSESEIQGNCIYYTKGENRTLYIYNLEDQSTTMTIPCPTINTINLYPHWVMIPDKCVLGSF